MSAMEATVHMETPWAEHACSEVLVELVAQADACWDESNFGQGGRAYLDT